MRGMHESGQQQTPRRLPDAVRPVLCSTGGFGQTITPTPGGNAGRDCQIPQRTFPRRGFGLSQGDLLGTPLSAAERELAELALSYPHEFGEWA